MNILQLVKILQESLVYLKPKTQSIVLVILFALFFIIFAYKTITRDKQLTPQSMTIYPTSIGDGGTVKPKQLPLDIYFTKEFDNQELMSAVKIADKWKNVSKGVAIINPHFYWEPPVVFDKSYYRNYKLTTIWKKQTNDPTILNIESSHGFMNLIIDQNFIIILDTDYNKMHFETLLTHGYGHLFGLGDLKRPYNGVMFITGNRGEITKYDMKLFCYMYEINCANKNVIF